MQRITRALLPPARTKANTSGIRLSPLSVQFIELASLASPSPLVCQGFSAMTIDEQKTRQQR